MKTLGKKHLLTDRSNDGNIDPVICTWEITERSKLHLWQNGINYA